PTGPSRRTIRSGFKCVSLTARRPATRRRLQLFSNDVAIEREPAPSREDQRDRRREEQHRVFVLVEPLVEVDPEDRDRHRDSEEERGPAREEPENEKDSADEFRDRRGPGEKTGHPELFDRLDEMRHAAEELAVAVVDPDRADGDAEDER